MKVGVEIMCGLNKNLKTRQGVKVAEIYTHTHTHTHTHI